MIVEVSKVGVDIPRTNRLYPMQVMLDNIERLQEFIDRRAFVGELYSNDAPTALVRFAHVSHLITELWVEDNSLMAQVELLKTAAGQTLECLLADTQVKVGFFMAGVGNGRVNDAGILVINDSYRLSQIYAASAEWYFGKRKTYRSIDDPWEKCLLEG